MTMIPGTNPGPSARTTRLLTLAGAGLGLVLFFTVGLAPSLLYSGGASAVLAGVFFGRPATPSLGAEAFVVLTMALGVTAVAALFAALGAAAGAAGGALTRARAGPGA